MRAIREYMPSIVRGASTRYCLRSYFNFAIYAPQHTRWRMFFLIFLSPVVLSTLTSFPNLDWCSCHSSYCHCFVGVANAVDVSEIPSLCWFRETTHSQRCLKVKTQELKSASALAWISRVFPLKGYRDLCAFIDLSLRSFPKLPVATCYTYLLLLDERTFLIAGIALHISYVAVVYSGVSLLCNECPLTLSLKIWRFLSQLIRTFLWKSSWSNKFYT